MMDNKLTADESDDDNDFDAKTLLLSGDMPCPERGGQAHYEYTSVIKTDELSSDGMEVYIEDYTLPERLQCHQAGNEFLECDTENCDRMLNSNKRIISFLLDLKKHITAALEKCEKKLTLVETSLRKHSNGDTKALICNASIPYFKDRDYFFPPNNEDETLKESYKELQLRNLPRVSPWTPRERNTLFKAIQEEAIADMLSSQKTERTEHANVTPKVPADATRQEQQKRRRIEKFPSRDLIEIIGPLRAREFDWFKISSVHFEDIHSPLDCRVMWNVFLYPDINKNCWTRLEDTKLKDIARKCKFQNWDKIAEQLNANRTAYQCFIRYNTTKKLPKVRNCVWENEEDKRLLSLVEIFKIGDFIPWGEIASWMPDRTKQQAYFRWTYSLAPYLTKGRFSKSEDNVLRDAITKYGTNFRKISAALMPNRSTVQLHDRYHTLTANRVKNWNVWTVENDSKLLELFQRFGPNWSQIATAFSSKTRTQLRHRHAALQRYINKGISILDLNRNRFKSKNLGRQEARGGEEEEDEGEEDEEEDDGDGRGREESDGAVFDFNNDDPSNGDYNSSVDKGLIEYFHIEHAIERSVRDQKLYTAEELECCTKSLYTTLKSLDAKLCMPSDVDDLKLKHRDRQLLCSLGEYLKAKHDKAMYLRVIDECSSRMFGTSYTVADKGSHFVPPPPFDSRVKLKKLAKTRCIDYDLNTKNTFLMEKTINLDTPDFVISQIGGHEQELQFQKICHLLEVYSSKGREPCDAQDVCTLQRRRRPRQLQQQGSSSSNDRNTLSDKSTERMESNARCKSVADTLFRSNHIFDRGHVDSRDGNCKNPLGQTTNIATLFSVLEKPRHSVPLFSSTATIKDTDISATGEATYATLQSFKNLMYMKRLNESCSGSNPGQLIIGSKKFIESLSLLETRLEKLFKYPVALSKTVLPEVYAIDTFSYDDVTLKRKASKVSCILETHKRRKSKSFVKYNGKSTY